MYWGNMICSARLREKSEYLVEEGLYVSPITDITLAEACKLQNKLCQSSHKSDCSQCGALISMANKVLDKGIIPLADLYRGSLPTKKYVSNKAVRLIMGMPFVIMNVGSSVKQKLYVMAKESGVDYTKLSKSMQSFRMVSTKSH